MVDGSQLQRMIDSMERALTRMEEEQAARHDAEDCELEEELAEGNTVPVAPSAPFYSDGAPQRIHGESSKKIYLANNGERR